MSRFYNYLLCKYSNKIGISPECMCMWCESYCPCKLCHSCTRVLHFEPATSFENIFNTWAVSKTIGKYSDIEVNDFYDLFVFWPFKSILSRFRACDLFQTTQDGLFCPSGPSMKSVRPNWDDLRPQTRYVSTPPANVGNPSVSMHPANVGKPPAHNASFFQCFWRRSFDLFPSLWNCVQRSYPRKMVWNC